MALVARVAVVAFMQLVLKFLSACDLGGAGLEACAPLIVAAC